MFMEFINESQIFRFYETHLYNSNNYGAKFYKEIYNGDIKAEVLCFMFTKKHIRISKKQKNIFTKNVLAQNNVKQIFIENQPGLDNISFEIFDFSNLQNLYRVEFENINLNKLILPKNITRFKLVNCNIEELNINLNENLEMIFTNTKIKTIKNF